ncbi:MAG: hypothetical protein ACSLFQ_20735 [Thermoanaerobaculia bacterium]
MNACRRGECDARNQRPLESIDATTGSTAPHTAASDDPTHEKRGGGLDGGDGASGA